MSCAVGRHDLQWPGTASTNAGYSLQPWVVRQQTMIDCRDVLASRTKADGLVWDHAAGADRVVGSSLLFWSGSEVVGWGAQVRWRHRLGVAGFDRTVPCWSEPRWPGCLAVGRAGLPVDLGVAPIAGCAGRPGGRPLVSTVESWLQLPGMVWAFVALAAGVILGWAVLRLRRGARPETPQQHRTRGSSVGAMALAGLAFGLTALLDPAFYAIVSVTARNSDVLVHLVGLVIWFVVAQWLLIGLVAVSLFDRQRTAAARLERAWT